MDRQRSLYWEWIERGLASAPDGMVYLSRAGRRMRKGFSQRWPPPGEARERAMRELRERLGALAESWVVYFAEDGAEEASCERWQWPAPEVVADGVAAGGVSHAEVPVGYAYADADTDMQEPDPFAVPAGGAGATEVPKAASFVVPALPAPPLPGEQEDRTPEPSEDVPAEALGRGGGVDGPDEGDADDTAADGASHHEVRWPGAGYFVLTSPQLRAAKLLIEAYTRGRVPDVASEDLLAAAGGGFSSVRVLFAGPAWGRLVLHGRTPGTYRVPALPPGEVADAG